MSSTISWNLKATLCIVNSLRKYVDLRFPYLCWPFVDFVLNNIEEGLKEYKNCQDQLSKNLDEVLTWNRWIISPNNSDLLNLQIQGRLVCGGGEILIIKSYSKNVAAAVKDPQYTYFLMAALSCNENVVYFWKDGTWNRETFDSYSANSKEPYYFYYCKVTSKSISKLLRLEDIYKANDSSFQLMIKIWKFTKKKNFLHSLTKEDNFNEERKRAQEEIKKLKSKIQELESEIEKYKIYINEYIINESMNDSLEKMCKEPENELKKRIKIIKDKEESRNEAAQLFNQKLSDLQVRKNILDSENFKLKNSLSEKESLLQKSSEEQHEITEKYKILQEKCKNLEEKLNKINYSQILYNPENEIIKLSPDRKHGLPNLGNTCYLNSLLQIFASTPLFVRKVESIDSPFCSSLSSILFNMLIENSSERISSLTKSFSEKLMEAYSNIGQCTQQDVKEVFNMILSKVEEEGGGFNIFSIVFHQVFWCLNLHKSTYDDTQTFLIIPPQHLNTQDNYLRNQKYYYSVTQPLFCNGCNREVDMNVELKDVDWPDYLVLYFPNPPNNILESICINNENIYEIYGAICYYKNEGSPHYTAFTKDGNKWNEYNDKYVETKQLNPYFVYMAFYSKKDPLSQTPYKIGFL